MLYNTVEHGKKGWYLLWQILTRSISLLNMLMDHHWKKSTERSRFLRERVSGKPSWPTPDQEL